MSALRARLHGGGQDDRGTVSLEFALLAPAVLVLLFGILALGLRMTFNAAGQDAARNTARYASLADPVTRAYPSSAQVSAKAASITVLGLAPASVAITPSGGCTKQGDEVTVTITYDLPGVSQAASAMPFVDASRLGQSTQTARAVCE